MLHAALIARGRRSLAMALVLALIAGAGLHGYARAQVGPVLPPARLYGAVTLFGQPAPVGVSIVALIEGAACGATTVDTPGRYVLDVRSTVSQAGCGVDGARVTFTVDGLPAREAAIYVTGAFIQRDLAASAPVAREARVTVERWAWYADEPCADPSGGWCITTYRLPPTSPPFARYRMLVRLVDGHTAQPAGWVVVTPGQPTAAVSATGQEGVTRVAWERWTLARSGPCRGRLESEWCVESVAVPPPVTGTVWYRLLVERPDGTVDEPTGFVALTP